MITEEAQRKNHHLVSNMGDERATWWCECRGAFYSRIDDFIETQISEYDDDRLCPYCHPVRC
jgi:hypothetical protein